MRPRIPIGYKLLASHLAAVLLVSACTAGYLYVIARDNLQGLLRARLLHSAALVSQSIELSQVENVAAQGASHPDYSRLLSQLRRMAMSNDDIAYLWVMQRAGDQVRFVADSDASPDQAQPGQVYENVVPALLKGFEQPAADAQIHHDHWGDFLSGYAPIPGGQGRFLVGLDMRAQDVADKTRRLREAGLLAALIGAGLAWLLSRALTRHLVRPIELLAQHSEDIAEGRLDHRIAFATRDELGALIAAYNAMASRLEDTRAKRDAAEQALQQERDLLEVRVDERTRELTRSNTALRDEITERRRIEQALQQAARTDPLTGLANRRALREQLDYQVARHQRSEALFTLILADVDHFKRVNDTWGHDAGDQVLCEVARRLRLAVRQQDIVARWGGEEFVVLLPDTETAGGAVLAEKLRAAIAASPVAAGEVAISVTASFGVSGFGETGGAERCIKAADLALYRAKQGGRNRVELATRAECTDA